VNGDYTLILNRVAEPGGLSYWTNQILSGASDENIINLILSSQEYLDHDLTHCPSPRQRGAAPTWCRPSRVPPPDPSGGRQGQGRTVILPSPAITSKSRRARASTRPPWLSAQATTAASARSRPRSS